MLTDAQTTMLRRLTLGDPTSLDAAMHEPGAGGPDRELAMHLARIAVLVAVGAPIATYQREVNQALSAGVTEAQITDLLPAIGPLVGAVAVMTAAPRLALTLGYDVDTDLEELGPATPH